MATGYSCPNGGCLSFHLENETHSLPIAFTPLTNVSDDRLYGSMEFNKLQDQSTQKETVESNESLSSNSSASRRAAEAFSQDRIIQSILAKRIPMTDVSIEAEKERQTRMYNMIRHSRQYKRMQVASANDKWCDNQQNHDLMFPMDNVGSAAPNNLFEAEILLAHQALCREAGVDSSVDTLKEASLPSLTAGSSVNRGEGDTIKPREAMQRKEHGGSKRRVSFQPDVVVFSKYSPKGVVIHPEESSSSLQTSTKVETPSTPDVLTPQQYTQDVVLPPSASSSPSNPFSIRNFLKRFKS